MATRLVCPRCTTPLRKAGTWLRCVTCGPFPVLGGIPILLDDAPAWCARHRNAIIASLADFEALTAADLATLDAFAGALDVEQEDFADDWTHAEATRDEVPAWPEGPALELLEALDREALARGPQAWLLERTESAKHIVEVGCGAGLLTELLCGRGLRVTVVDTSLRAVLTTLNESREASGVVGSAEALPVRGADVVVAENVVDLLSAPEAFFASARAAAKRLLVTTPDPQLGAGPDAGDEVSRLAQRAKWKRVEHDAALPWLRRNTSRFTEVYLVDGYAFR